MGSCPNVMYIYVHPCLSFLLQYLQYLFNKFKWLLQCFILLFGHFGKKKKKESNLSV